MAYTDDEIGDVVARLLPAGAVRTYDSLGVRRTDLSFNKLQESAAGVFLLYPTAPHYVASLAAQRVLQSTTELSELLGGLIASVRTLRRRSVPVEDISSLSNARAALIELEGVVTSNTPPENLTTVPAYNRFSDNLDRFLKKISSNVKQQGQIVPTPQEARLNIPAQLEEVQRLSLALLEQVSLLRDAIQNYEEVDLARRVSRTVVQNARALLDSREQSLQQLDPTARLQVLRETVLEVLAMRGVVAKFGAFQPASAGIPLTGVGSPYADGSHPATPAELVADAPGAYSLVAGEQEEDSRNILYAVVNRDGLLRYNGPVTASVNTLTRSTGSWLDEGVAISDRAYFPAGANVGRVLRVSAVSVSTLTLEGDPLTSGGTQVQIVKAPDLFLALPPSVVAKFEGITNEPFNISASNNKLLFDNGTNTYPITLTTGATQFAPAVVADMNAGLAGSGYHAEEFFLPLNFEGAVSVSGNTLSMPYSFPASVSVGDEVDFVYGQNTGATRMVTFIGPGTLTLNGAALVASSADRVRVGKAARGVRIVPDDPYMTLALGTTIYLRTPTAVETAGNALFGFYGPMIARSVPTDALTIVDFINGNNNVVGARVAYTSSTVGLSGHSDPSDGRVAVFTSARGVGTWGSGNNITIAVTSLTITGTPQVGDIIVLRGGYNPNLPGTVTAITANSITANFSTPVSATSGPGAFDIGFDPGLGVGDVVMVDSGVNAGRYIIEYMTPGIPFQFTMRTTLPFYRANFNDSVDFVGSAGEERVVVQSRNTLVSSSIAIFDPGGVFFDEPVNGPTYGTTTYFQVPEAPRTLGVDDVLELHTTSAGDPDLSLVINAVEGTVLTLEAPIPTRPLSYTMQAALVMPPPSAIVRDRQRFDFSGFREQLQTWLRTQPASNLPGYFIDVNRLMNVLLQNENPTDAECGAAEQRVRALQALLTIVASQSLGNSGDNTLESILGAYQVDREVEVDTLIRTFRDKGADRAADLLLECRFTTFFGLTQEETSYGGSVQAAIRNVAMNDMPVNKYDRLETNVSQLKASIPSKDYEFDDNDVDESLAVDPI